MKRKFVIILTSRPITSIPKPTLTKTVTAANSNAVPGTSNVAGQPVASSQKIDLNTVGQIAGKLFPNSYLGKDVYDVDLDGFGDKPWKKAGADITDFFNFGFQESSWKEYADKQNLIRSGQQGQMDMQQMMQQMMAGFPMMEGFQNGAQSSQPASSKRKRKARPIDEECIIDLSNR
jgi:hypothetical protein